MFIIIVFVRIVTRSSAVSSQDFYCFFPRDQSRDVTTRWEFLLLLLLKKIGNARPGEGDCHPISPKTPAPPYQPIEEKKRKGK